MATTDEQILELNDLILGRDTTIGLRDNTIASKDDIITARNALIAQQNETILSQGNSITELQNRVTELEAASSGSGSDSGSDSSQYQEYYQTLVNMVDAKVEDFADDISGRGLDPDPSSYSAVYWFNYKMDSLISALQAKGYSDSKITGDTGSWINSLSTGGGMPDSIKNVLQSRVDNEWQIDSNPSSYASHLDSRLGSVVTAFQNLGLQFDRFDYNCESIGSKILAKLGTKTETVTPDPVWAEVTEEERTTYHLILVTWNDSGEIETINDVSADSDRYCVYPIVGMTEENHTTFWITPETLTVGSNFNLLCNYDPGAGYPKQAIENTLFVKTYNSYTGTASDDWRQVDEPSVFMGGTDDCNGYLASKPDYLIFRYTIPQTIKAQLVQGTYNSETNETEYTYTLYDRTVCIRKAMFEGRKDEDFGEERNTMTFYKNWEDYRYAIRYDKNLIHAGDILVAYGRELSGTSNQGYTETEVDEEYFSNRTHSNSYERTVKTHCGEYDEIAELVGATLNDSETDTSNNKLEIIDRINALLPSEELDSNIKTYLESKGLMPPTNMRMSTNYVQEQVGSFYRKFEYIGNHLRIYLAYVDNDWPMWFETTPTVWVNSSWYTGGNWLDYGSEHIKGTGQERVTFTDGSEEVSRTAAYVEIDLQPMLNLVSDGQYISYTLKKINLGYKAGDDVIVVGNQEIDMYADTYFHSPSKVEAYLQALYDRTQALEAQLAEQ